MESSPFGIIGAMLATLLLGLSLAPKFDFYGFGPYDSGVPKPESILAYGPGERHTTYRDQEKVFDAIAGKAPARTKRFDYGASTEGRPLRVYAISSPANMTRLPEIRKRILELSEGKGSVAADLPAIVWINQTIHGNETASFESAMWLFYNLTASRNPGLMRMLDRAVIILNPVYNPDGHERFVVWYNSIATGNSNPFAYEHGEPRVVHGRTNHYRFDMNRDRISMSQQETRAEVAEFQKWMPQVYGDQPGQVEPYFFPPTALASNTNLGRDRVNKWMEIFGRASASDFDKQGWPYFIRETFDYYAPCYLDTWSTLSGAIGMTHETDGGRKIAEERSDGTVLTLRDGMEKHFVAALAVARAASERHTELLDSFRAFRAKSVSGEHAGKFQRVVVTGDSRALSRLGQLLLRSGIKSELVAKFKQADAVNYWTGEKKEVEFPERSLVIDMAQGQGALAKALLEVESDFEPEFIAEQKRRREQEKKGETNPRGEGYEFYDLTAWSLPLAFGLDAWWCESRPPVQPSPKKATESDLPESKIGYLIPYEDDADILAIYRLMRDGVRVQVLSRETKLDGRTFAPGTFLVPVSRNEQPLHTLIPRYGVSAHSIKSAFPDSGRTNTGSEDVRSLRKPNIAVVFGDGDRITQFGPMWYLMEKVWELPFTAITAQNLGGDLSRYSCVVCPGGPGYTMSDKLREWVSNGGCLVLLGGDRWAQGERGFFTLERGKEGPSLPGTMYRAKVDRRFDLAYGVNRDDVAIVLDGESFPKMKTTGGNVIHFGEPKPRFLSGWTWGEESEAAISGSVWLYDQPVGRGRVVYFANDPTERAMFPGLFKFVLNSMLFGPR